MFNLPMRLGENEVQAAIRGALEAYADRCHLNAQFFEPYANQQGAGAQRFGADLLAVLDDARILMLEVKALDVPRHMLVHFNPAQHADCCDLEDFGVPIAYAFNATESLAYYDRSRSRSWPNDTLQAICRAQPTRLPGQIPARSHPSLLSWLELDEGTDIAEQLGWLLGSGVARPRVLTNAVLVLVYSVDAKQLLCFTPNDALALTQTLRSVVGRSVRNQALLQRLFKGQADASVHLRPSEHADEDTNNHRSRPPRP